MKLLRSPREIAFRLRQEAANALLALFPPAPDLAVPSPLPGLPDPFPLGDQLQVIDIEGLADAILAHRFPLLGLQIEPNGEIPWRSDVIHGKTSEAKYFRAVPYLNFDAVGDHKIVWELNRHQHFVILAQAFARTGRAEYFNELIRQWEDWEKSNPFQRGINWASALEVAFRALSWIWVYHLAGSAMSADLRRRFLTSLYRHGCHLEYNLSVYFSPNTHLLGEAVALHAIGALFPGFPRSAGWRKLGGRVVREELTAQVREDGAHFEQSTYYHVYALDFFLLHYLLAGRPSEFVPVLERMADYLEAVMGPARRIPLIGDDDGGRLFHPYGRHDEYGRDTLAACAIAIGHPRSAKPESRLFRETGTAVLASDELWAMVDVGGYGPFRAGHSHSDTLSIVVRRRDQDLLVDSGTYTYVGDPHWRDWFRGSAAHNTLRIDGRNQAPTAGPFAWSGKPVVRIREWISDADHDYLDAVCEYAEASYYHRRRVLFLKPGTLLVLDEAGAMQGSPSDRVLVEQFWHVGGEAAEVAPGCFRIGDAFLLTEQESAHLQSGGDHGWRSTAYGRKEPAPVIIAGGTLALPATFATAIMIGDVPGKLTFTPADGGIVAIEGGTTSLRVRFAESGLPTM